jgi:hypothetical protein
MTFDVIADILELNSFPKDLLFEKLLGNYKEIVLPTAGILQNSVIFLFLPFLLLLIVGLV